jgi:hypothetical protein
MTTFTLQELNLPITAEQAIETITKEQWMEYGMSHPISQSVMDYATQHIPEPTTEDILNNIRLPHAPEPQPTLCESTQTDLPSIINNICAQLQLLATVINQSKAQPEGNQSLQECVSLTLQQADWFKDLIRHELIGAGIEDLAKDAVEEVVESEVESYFEHNFDPSYHFDFDDAVIDAVDDRIDGIVSDKIDDAVESYMSGATITISK